MEKWAYALVRALKSFRVYILQYKVIAYVPSNIVKEILMQLDSHWKRTRWVFHIQEYESEIKPTKLIKGH